MIASAWKAAGWWQGLQPNPDRGLPGDRAALARLRRCAVVSEAMQEVATMALFQHVGATRYDDLPSVALAAAVLAHVRRDAVGTVARLVGPTSLSEPETAKLKPLRLRRLMEAVEPDERLVAFRRLIAIADSTLPVRDLALSLLDWSENRRRRWLYDYWDAGAPPGDTESSTATPAASQIITPAEDATS